MGPAEGDLIVLGVAGKMGPSLARMARRGRSSLAPGGGSSAWHAFLSRLRGLNCNDRA